MSVSNEEIIEEIMWIAFEQDKAVELVEIASSYLLKEKTDRVTAYENAFRDLKLDKNKK